MCVFVGLHHKKRLYISVIYVTAQRCTGGLKKKINNCLGKNYYIASCPGDRQL